MKPVEDSGGQGINASGEPDALEVKPHGLECGSVLRALTALPEVPSSNLSNHMVADNHL